jgi:hypothetical protein
MRFSRLLTGLFFSCVLLFSHSTYAQLQEDGEVKYRGHLEIHTITVEKDNERKVYRLLPEALNFLFWERLGVLQAGEVTRCPPYIGVLIEDLNIPLNVTAHFREKFDEHFNKTEIPAGPNGKGHIHAPAGSRVFGTCSDHDLRALFEMTLESGDQTPLRLELDK